MKICWGEGFFFFFLNLLLELYLLSQLEKVGLGQSNIPSVKAFFFLILTLTVLCGSKIFLLCEKKTKPKNNCFNFALLPSP